MSVKTFDVLQCFWENLNETSRGERRAFNFEESAQFIGQWSCENYFSYCLTGWKSLKPLNATLCANLIKIETKFLFILMKWNTTSSKMVRNNIPEK